MKQAANPVHHAAPPVPIQRERIIDLKDGISIQLPPPPPPRSAHTFNRIVYIVAVVAGVFAGAAFLVLYFLGQVELFAAAAVGLVPVLVILAGTFLRTRAFNLWAYQTDGCLLELTAGRFSVHDRTLRWVWPIRDVAEVTFESVFASFLFIRAWRLDVHFHDQGPHPILYGYPADELEEVAVAVNQVLALYRLPS